MRRPGRRALIAAGAATVVVVGGLGVAGLAVRGGWLDEGSVEGGTSGFVPQEAPPEDAGTGSWPEFGFDAGRSRANTELALRPPYRRAWRVDGGSLLEFPPVIGDGRVIVGTNRGLGMAVDLATGRVLWRTRLGGTVASSPALTGIRPGAAGPAARPALALFTTTRGDLLALDPATGAIRWRKRFGSAIESSPLVIGDGVYIGTLDGRVMRFSLQTRRIVWTARAKGDVKSSLAESGDTVVVGDYGGTIAAYAKRDGRQVWRTTSPGPRFRGAGRFYAGPAVAYGRVYLGNVNGRMLALSARDGSVAWVRVVGDFIYSSAAVSRRTVFVGSYDRNLYALDAVTGRVRWTHPAGERISGAPSVIGDVVWYSTLAKVPSRGRTVGLDVRTGDVVFTHPEGRYSPAVGADGVLVLTGVRTLTAFTPRKAAR